MRAWVQERALLQRTGVRVVTAKLQEVFGDEDGRLAGAVLEDGTQLPLK